MGVIGSGRCEDWVFGSLHSWPPPEWPEVVLEDEAGSTGYHVPEGTLLIRDPLHRAPKPVVRPRIDTVDIAPATLAHFQ